MLFKVQNVHKSYKDVQAVKGISFEIDYGICFTFLGKNGAGKTTTIEMMEGILKPDAGEILYKDKPLDNTINYEAGIMFQSTALQEFITIKEMLTMFHRLFPDPPPVNQIIELCQLQEIQNRAAKKISGGQKQRLLLAIALINDPQIVFLDEPTTGLDPKTRRTVWAIIEGLKKKGKTIVLTTHYMEEAYELSDQLLIMDKGKIIAQGSPSALLKEHYDDSVLELPAMDVPNHDIIPDAVVDKDRLRIYSTDVNQTISQLLKANISLQHLQIRNRNLEDLFLAITTDANQDGTIE